MYVVTGATGALGRLAVEALLQRVPAGQVRATGRRIETLDDLAARGVEVRRADYDDPASLAAAFAGATRVLFVSGSDAGARIAQHRAVVDAVAAADVELVGYTSILFAQTSDMVLATEHAATERMLADAGVPTSCCATAGTSRTSSRPSRRTSSTGWSAPPATGASTPPPAPTTPRPPPRP